MPAPAGTSSNGTSDGHGRARTGVADDDPCPGKENQINGGVGKVAQALRTENRPVAEVRVAEETPLRVETAGYGGVPVRAIIPGEALSGIERGDLRV